MNSVTPVILAGGMGTRLWPVSRKSFPKQFSKIIGGDSLFQDTLKRLHSSDIVNFSKHLTITNEQFRFIVTEQFHAIGIDPGPILIEPNAKNTAPAVIAAALFCYERDKEAVLLVTPSDHLISDHSTFHGAVSKGLEVVNNKKIVTFGVSPEGPETGYGYLRLKSKSQQKLVDVEAFVEKPDLLSAKQMVSSGQYFWNSGIFLFKAKEFLELAESYAGEIVTLVESSIREGHNDLGFFRIGPKSWDKCENISIDYALMEKTSQIVAVPLNCDWSDLGDWSTVMKEKTKKNINSVEDQNITSIDCKNTLLRSEKDNMHLVGLGLENIIAVAMNDAVLVANKDRSQDVKFVVRTLVEKKVSQAENFTKDYRPWGWFESLAIGPSFQVKRIVVNSNEKLSLQSHRYRSEHWVVVEGVATVTLDEKEINLNEGQSVFVPQGCKHRLSNNFEENLIIIEVQIGSYFGEDDIIRYEDIYSRA